MNQDILEKRNFFFFLNHVYPPKYEDSLVGALSSQSSWESIAEIVNSSRKNDEFVRSIKLIHLYVHVPFCAKLCSYCGCSKVLLQRASDIETYIKALKQQMLQHAPLYKGMDAASISFGGGTPSILDEEQLTSILDGVDDAFPTNDRKIHIEIHPTSWTESKLKLLSSRGLYRVSIGVQTLDDQVLRGVSRSQIKQHVLWCIDSARKANIPKVNVDLIAGLAGQTVDGFIQDLKKVVKEGANIVHVQPLSGSTIKELCAPGESVPQFKQRRDDMMKEAIQILKEEGFRCKRQDGWSLNEVEKDYLEEAYIRLEAAVAAFGPFARGVFPGAVYYCVDDKQSVADFRLVKASTQDKAYVMSHCAAWDIFDVLDEQVFLKRFGVKLNDHCGEGLRFLQEFGLVACSNGKWTFSGVWNFRRVRELYALSRVLYSEDLISRLRTRYATTYDPKMDYSEGVTLIDSFARNPLIGLYYSR